MRLARWHTSPLPYGTSRELARTLGVSEITAGVLARRGHNDPESARRFLSPEGELHDPFLFPQMQAVRERLLAAISSGEKICVHGDYDVDGVTSTALLVSVLGNMGANISHHLPNRFSQGYGVSSQVVEKIAAGGASLLVTVDCGIGAKEEIELARQLGLDAIVIDHHRPVEGSLPPALIISPLLCDYPFKDLAGVGLAFKVAQGLTCQPGHNKSDLPGELRLLLDLVALGTIADVVPLLDENRSLVKRGLVQMARSLRPGLKALMKIGQVDQLKLSAGMVAFRLAPRINAAGRLEDPGPALELLLAEDEGTACKLAAHLDSLNQERQRIENKMLAEAQEIVNRWPEDVRSARGYVLSSPGWHEGVIGIVASKMVELHNRPVIMIAEGEKHGKGSGRSIPSFNLHEALLELGHMLKSFGGHSAACGLTIEPGGVAEFRQAFARYACENITDDLQPRRYVDAIVCGRELTLDLAEELTRMEPFGLGNPSVDLLATGVRIKRGRKTRNGQHLQCQIEAGGAISSAIGFGQAFLLDKVNSHPDWDVIFRLEQNEFNGSVSPQLNLRDLIPRQASAESPPGLCTARCDYECQDRVKGAEFWSLLDEKTGPGPFLEKFAEILPAGDPGANFFDRLIDRRNFGSIPGQVARLIATGQSILLLAADVPRRRRLISTDLSTTSFDLDQVLLAGERCAAATLNKRLQDVKEGSSALLLTDFATVLTIPDLAGCFQHVVFIDPPPAQGIFSAVAAAAPEAWLHLFYCGDEVQFTGKVLEHEYILRAPLIKVYKHLKTGQAHPFDETTERLLLAGGKYLRQPALIARCLKVLEELALISVEERDGGPILTLSETGKTDLERSPTYRASESFYERCLKYLSKSLNAKPT